MQDIFSLVDLHKLKKSPTREMRRLLDILLEREIPGDQRNKYVRIKKALTLVLLLSKKARKMTVVFFSNMDLEKVKLDEADWYYCLQRHQYNYRGISIQDRVNEKKRIDIEKGHKIPIFEWTEKPIPHFKMIDPK